VTIASKCAFLGEEREELDRLVRVVLGCSLETRREEEVFDQLVELRDVRGGLAHELRSCAGLRAEDLDGDTEPRERRPELVRGAREKASLRPDERLDALRGAIEASREVGDLVSSLDRHTRREIAAAELLDARAQALETPCDATRDRIRAEGDHARDREETERPVRPLVAASREREAEPATVAQAYGNSR